MLMALGPPLTRCAGAPLEGEPFAVTVIVVYVVHFVIIVIFVITVIFVIFVIFVTVTG